MEKINAVITGVGGYVPDYILTNDEICKIRLSFMPIPPMNGLWDV